MLSIYKMLDKSTFAKLCTPAKIYFAIAVISSIFALFNGFGLLMVFWKLLFAFIWTYILGWLCKKGYSTISWFLVLLPYIVIALAMFRIYRMGNTEKQLLKTIKLQGAYGQEGMSSGNVAGVAGGVLIGVAIIALLMSV